jgi:uncharacterized protein (DUF58 family)
MPDHRATPGRPHWRERWSPARRLRRWWQQRLPRTDQLQLTQRNVYILPSRAGWALALMLCLLLLGSINYQINLGYLLTFLLAGSAAAGMVVGHGNLRGTGLHLVPPAGGFAGQPCRFDVVLHNTRRAPRWGLGLAVHGEAGAADWAWVDVPGQGSSTAQLAFTPQRRGRQPLPTLTAATRYPLGTFRVWALWRPASQVWIYPTPEPNAPPLPPASADAGGRSTAATRYGDEFDGVRAYRHGDALKLVVWKKAAQAFATGSHQLVSRDRPLAQQHRLWLDARATGLADHEARLSRLTAWVQMAQHQGLSWGLRLPDGQEIAPDQGPAHATRCLQALAACP